MKGKVCGDEDGRCTIIEDCGCQDCQECVVDG